MNVTLLTHTHDPLRVLFTAAHTCYSPSTAGEVWVMTGDETSGYDDARMLRTVRGCIVRNHNTVLRHAVFTFALDDISRACATQLTRHGPGWFYHDSELDGISDQPAFDQQSQRYVRMDVEPSWVIPPHVDDMAAAIMRASAHRAWLDYRALIDSGVHHEDARGVLPQDTPCNLTATVNLAALLHFWAVRGQDATGKAQDEIKAMAHAMVAAVVAAEPWLGEFFPIAPDAA